MDYYILLQDSTRGDLESIADYEMGDFDLTFFWQGRYFEGQIPDEVQISLSEGSPTDYLDSPISWPMFSQRVIDLLLPFCEEHVQLIPVKLWKKGRAVTRFTIVNALGLINAVVGKRRTDLILQRLKLDPNKIPRDRHLFRLKRLPSTYVLSEPLFEALKGKGLKGLAARKVLQP